MTYPVVHLVEMNHFFLSEIHAKLKEASEQIQRYGFEKYNIPEKG